MLQEIVLLFLDSVVNMWVYFSLKDFSLEFQSDSFCSFFALKNYFYCSCFLNITSKYTDLLSLFVKLALIRNGAVNCDWVCSRPISRQNCMNKNSFPFRATWRQFPWQWLQSEFRWFRHVALITSFLHQRCFFSLFFLFL